MHLLRKETLPSIFIILFELRVDDSDFLSKGWTDGLSLCKAMVSQVFPNAAAGESWGVSYEM